MNGWCRDSMDMDVLLIGESLVQGLHGHGCATRWSLTGAETPAHFYARCRDLGSGAVAGTPTHVITFISPSAGHGCAALW